MKISSLIKETNLNGKTWNMRKPKTRIIRNVFLRELFEKIIGKIHLTDWFEKINFNGSFEKNNDSFA